MAQRRPPMPRAPTKKPGKSRPKKRGGYAFFLAMNRAFFG